MDDSQGRLGSAQVRWNDYVGTAAADDADAVFDTRSLYEIAGLDRNQWTIVGMDLSLDESAEQVVVYAIDRTAGGSEWADSEEVFVTPFPLGPSIQLTAFLGEAFKRISIRLVSNVVQDKQLVVAGRS